MGSCNINRNVSDQFNRYTMPRIIAKVEGKGNGIKTVIANMSEVAKALQRPPTYPTKYFGCELGAQTQFDHKNERYIVNGAHNAVKLQDLLDGFIRKFVLCPRCDNPETTLSIQAKKGMILQRCLACGHIGNIDMRHKLTTFILKNPPDQDPMAMTPSKKEKKVGKKGKPGKESEGSPEAGDAPHDNTVTPETIIKPRKAAIDDDDEDWGEDTSEEAVQQRMQELSSAAKTLTINDDVEKPQQQRIDILYAFVKLKKDADQLTGKMEKDIVTEAERLDIKDKAPLVLAELLFDENIMQQIKRFRTLFLRFTQENEKAQKYLLGGFEQLVGNVYPSTLMVKVPHILKAFYDADILDEDTLIEWDKKASKKYVSKEVSKEIHTKAAPFIKWLMVAEEETSEEEEEDEDAEIVYSNTEKVGTVIVTKTEKADDVDGKTAEDDLDIDAI
ncbi:hypothetical protein NP493_438g02012 [Ridgeia piscesae]|uniref:Eukaryotic translation initiation factor 5 n=1 Tax=Ridgeia piscesae TaxID=27915 RepID=A0AAD9KZH6_RIDPI|nr:hypothetical protein NP493_438g02012 [Ridgeia piscesae]